MRIFAIPGLGFDHRIFEKLTLNGVEWQFLDWIEPEPKENLRNYAIRLAEKIPKDEKHITLIGHSLGGIVSQEIAAIRKVEKIILISSIKSRDEMPFQFKIVKPLGIQRLFLKSWTVKSLPLWGKQHGYETEEEQTLFISMVKKHSNHYLQWALRQLSIWEPPEITQKTEISQIHGHLDKTFPADLIKKPDYWVEKGTHFMVFRQPIVLSNMINQILISG